MKYKLSRVSLRILYVSYIRSVLEYADCVWDNLPDYQVNRLEKINICAIRCITGLTISTRKADLYAESGLVSLSTRRKYHRLVQYYKIVNNLAPQYLQDILPETAGQRNPYQVRNERMYTPFRCNTESYRNSFFPLTTRDWNRLPNHVRLAQSLPEFKFKLKQLPEFSSSCPPRWYSYGPRKLNILLTQMRRKSSPLQNDLYQNHIVDSSRCTNCMNAKAEDAEHFFLKCPRYRIQRRELHREFDQQTATLDIQTILHGDLERNYEDNKPLVNAVLNFIRTTSRFI